VTDLLNLSQWLIEPRPIGGCNFPNELLLSGGDVMARTAGGNSRQSSAINA